MKNHEYRLIVDGKEYVWRNASAYPTSFDECEIGKAFKDCIERCEAVFTNKVLIDQEHLSKKVLDK
jgi:hypothetical protein